MIIPRPPRKCSRKWVLDNVTKIASSFGVSRDA
jgi:hypothetical protein